MPNYGSSTVLKSASVGLLVPGNTRGRKTVRSDEDPLEAVLNCLSKSSSQSTDATKNAKRSLSSAGRCNLAVNTNKNPQDCEGRGDTTPGRMGRGDTTPGRISQQSSRRPVWESVVKEPRHRHAVDLFSEADLSPVLLAPPRNRRAASKLVFDDQPRNELDQSRQSEQEKFVDYVQRLQNLVSQATVRLNDMIASIRTRIRDDADCMELQSNHDQLAEVSYEISTANYYLAKWLNQLDPLAVRAPSRPEKIEDMPVKDMMADVQGSIARMEILAAGLAPLLKKVVFDARNVRRRSNDQPLSPSARDPIKVAAKRGFTDVDGMYHFVEHLEHLLDETDRLAHPPKNGLEDSIKILKGSTTVILAAARFKTALTKKADRVTDVTGVVNPAFKKISDVASSDAKERVEP